MALAWRHKLPPRHLETLLQGLVHARILKGVRDCRGGYELARERGRISVGEIVRTAMSFSTADPEALGANSVLLERVIDPAVRNAGKSFLANLDSISIKRCARRQRGRMCSTTKRRLPAILPSDGGPRLPPRRVGVRTPTFSSGRVVELAPGLGGLVSDAQLPLDED